MLIWTTFFQFLISPNTNIIHPKNQNIFQVFFHLKLEIISWIIPYPPQRPNLKHLQPNYRLWKPSNDEFFQTLFTNFQISRILNRKYNYLCPFYIKAPIALNSLSAQYKMINTQQFYPFSDESTLQQTLYFSATYSSTEQSKKPGPINA